MARRRITIEGDDLRFSAAHMATMGGKVEPLHGHSYRVRVKLEGDLTADAWVFDFVELRRIVLETCRELDHRFLLQAESSLLNARDLGESWEVVAGKKRYLLPKADVVPLPLDNLTAERLAEWICGRLKAKLASKKLTAISVELFEGPGQSASHSESF